MMIGITIKIRIIVTLGQIKTFLEMMIDITIKIRIIITLGQIKNIIIVEVML